MTFDYGPHFFNHLECTTLQKEGFKLEGKFNIRGLKMGGFKFTNGSGERSEQVGVDAGTSTLHLILFHHMYIFSIQPCFVLKFDAWITFFQELSAVMCKGAQDLF